MPKLTVNSIEVEVEQGASVLQACEEAGFEIPRFCYHERLSIAGNCRMCLVDMERAPKPVASCAMPAADGMVISTQSDRVKKAREGVMEFLLLNHPLDCPICDQGGECDLQDQAMGYGHDGSRYKESKRAVEEKQMGPLIKTIMTRCIHCTRCVRFATEVAGVPELGAIGRGEQVEITTYLEKTIASELSANVIDLCPVGALTSKPYAFISRPWELNKTESIDVMDAQGSNIRIDSRGNQVMRVMPRLNEDVNEEWISDKARFAIDGLKNQRLDTPYVRKENGKLEAASWDQAFAAIAKNLKRVKPANFGVIAGDQIDAETMFAMKSLMEKIGSPHMDCRQDGANIDVSARGGYLFNTTIAGIDQADAVLIVGSNPRIEAPVMNARIRKRYLSNGLPVAYIGEKMDLTYPADCLGSDAQIIKDIINQTHPFSEVLKSAKNPMVIVGNGVLTRDDSQALLFQFSEMIKTFEIVHKGWNGFNLLHKAASRVAGLDIGFVPNNKTGKSAKKMLADAGDGNMGMIWLLGADEIDTSKLDNCFIVYQGHHGDAGAHAADVILPGAAYTEKNGLYLNFEGRVQETKRAAFPPGEAKDDWSIIRAFSAVIGQPLAFDTHDACRQNLITNFPHFAEIGQILPSRWKRVGKSGKISTDPIVPSLQEFYMTCSISRASKTMAESRTSRENYSNQIAAE
ncbi:MAG: NADH-quinone oxidoreductase subunit G [Alphaproteobacteria bacterium]|jgi:NADH-quinone oxidoreductase subunit G|nr:NADH-quinone oxidoreductase subunit G [Alphaproteobacteria bacterium]